MDPQKLRDVQATPSELDRLAGTRPGERSNSKAVVVDGDGAIDALDVTTLSLGGTALTPSASELNTLSGITASTTELNLVDGLSKLANVVGPVALGQDAGAGGVLAWENPESGVIFAAVLFDITTEQSGQTADVGVAANGTTSADTLMDGISLATATQRSSFTNPGTNGSAFRKLTASQFITATASGTPSSLVGNAYIVYFTA